MTTLGMAIIGIGAGATPHLQSLAKMSGDVTVRWALCRNLQAARLGPLDGVPKLTSDLDEILADPRVDAVIVATPASTHLDIATRCLDAGKHTLVEKPLEVTLDRAERLVRHAAASGVRFGSVLQHRFRPGAAHLRQLMASGELGALQSASVAVPWWRSQTGYYDQPGRGTFSRDGGGVLLTQAIHAIDLFRSLVGVREVVAAQAVTTAIHDIETEDHVSARLTLGNGAPGLLTATTAIYPGRAEALEFIFAKASASLVGGALAVHFHDGRKIVTEAEGKSGSGDNIMDFSHEAHKAVIQDFVQAIREGRDPAVNGEEALETHRLIQGILSAAKFPTGARR